MLAVPDWPGHRAGQHVDVRLTADDGYQTQRSYSIASAPSSDQRIALTVERLDDGEVSPYLAGELHAGDKLELRGPIGGYFVWEAALGGPLLLVAGGKAEQDERYHKTIRESVDALLGAVSEADRILLIMKEVEGLSLKELEKIYKVNENALKVRLFRARQRVLKAFGAAEKKEDAG